MGMRLQAALPPLYVDCVGQLLRAGHLLLRLIPIVLPEQRLLRPFWCHGEWMNEHLGYYRTPRHQAQHHLLDAGFRLLASLTSCSGLVFFCVYQRSKGLGLQFFPDGREKIRRARITFFILYTMSSYYFVLQRSACLFIMHYPLNKAP